MFADTPGVKLTYRTAGIGKVLGNITREVAFDQPMVQTLKRGRALWNRRPRQSLDVEAWRLGILEAERLAPSVARLSSQRVDTNAGLTDWVRRHRF